MMALNELRRLIESGAIGPEDVESIIPGGGNMLAQLMQPQQMPQPDNSIAPMQQNTMRNEQTGEVTNLDFGPRMGQAQQKLGERIEVPGKGVGRYSQDGRSVVFADGSTKDMHPERSWELAKRDFERQKSEQGLKLGEQNYRQGEAQLAQQAEQTAALQAQRTVKEDQNSQPFLDKKYGKAPKDMQWSPDGRAVPIAGGPAEQQAAIAADGGTETVRKIDEMVGKRDAQGNLLPGSKPHEGFEDAVGATWKPFAQHIPGTDAADFKARLDEIKGGAFLKAFETLKGGGQITEMEGKKATDAITRMGLAQSEGEFVKAATEFREVVRVGVERSRSQSESKTFGSMPDPAKYAGKRIEAPGGLIYKSDGKSWKRQ